MNTENEKMYNLIEEKEKQIRELTEENKRLTEQSTSELDHLKSSMRKVKEERERIEELEEPITNEEIEELALDQGFDPGVEFYSWVAGFKAALKFKYKELVTDKPAEP